MKKNNVGETEKSKFKIKALDIVIILLVLASVVGVYFRYNIMDVLTGSRNMKDHTVSFEIKDVRYSTEPYINVGDKVYFANDGSVLGTLIEASDDSKNALIVVPSIMSFTTHDGSQMVEVPCPANSRIDASGRLICRGKSSDGGFLLDGTKYITEGDTISVMTELVTVDIIITDITLNEE